MMADEESMSDHHGEGDVVHARELELREDSSVFNRLENTRTMLEMELGLSAMLRGYKLIQVRLRQPSYIQPSRKQPSCIQP